MTNPLRWNAVLLPDGTVQAEPPVCMFCHGRQGKPYPHIDQALAMETIHADICPACHGTGHGPCWRIQPENWVGGLVDSAAGWFIAREYQNSAFKRRFAEWEYDCDPIAPPPSAGCTLPQALSLLPGAIATPDAQEPSWIDQVRIPLGKSNPHANAEFVVLYDHICGLSIPTIEGETMYFDPDAAILAATRVKQLQQYIAGWREGK